MAAEMEIVDQDRFQKLKEMYAKDDFGACFANLHLKIERNVEQIKLDVSEVKGRVAHLENFSKEAEVAIRTINESAIPNVCTKIENESKERLKLEILGRKWNLVIRGVDGEATERGRVTLDKVKTFFKDVLKAPSESVDEIHFQACHRLPSGPEGKKNIIVRFCSLLDRDDILALAMKLPPKSGYSVVVDLPKSVAERRSALLKKRAEMPEAERKKTKVVYVKEFPFVTFNKK